MRCIAVTFSSLDLLHSAMSSRVRGLCFNFAVDPPALMLSYQTDISLNDKAALEKEIEDIWGSFRPDVEKAGLVNAIISANEPPGPGFLSKSRGINFVYKRASDGKWSR